MAVRYDCFLSYASADVAIAEALEKYLTSNGFSVWFDKVRLRPGFDWHREIEGACEASRIVLPILTPRWSRSEWTKYETYSAAAIIPIVAEGRFEDVATPPLQRVQAASIAISADGPAGLALAEAIRSCLAASQPGVTDRQERLVHLRYRPAAVFVGREREMERLHEQLHVLPSVALTQGRVQAIAALGGVGKTTMARMYAEKFWRTYEVILWVDARLGYESEFARLLEVLRPDLEASLRDAPDARRAERARREIETLTTSRPLMTAGLLIIDNAEDERSTAAWIPSNGQIHTIVTSRYAHWEAIPICHIYVLEPAAARALLLRRSGRPDPEAVSPAEIATCDALARILGYLPLALEQAATYMRTQGAGFAFDDYLRLYGETERALLSMPIRGTTEYPEPLFVTWLATMAKLPAGAQVMLRLAGFLASTEIPIGLFQDSADTVTTLSIEFPDAPADAEPAAGGSAELRVRAWREALANYSMVQAPSGDTFVVHGLVQAVERGQLDEVSRRRWLSACVEVFAKHAPVEASRVEHWRAWRTLLPHAQALLAEATAAGIRPVPTGLLRPLSSFYDVQGRYADALPLAEQVLDQDEQALGPEHPETLTSVTNLALLYFHMGNYPRAHSFFRRGLEARERILGAEHRDTVITVSNLALLYERQGDYAAAEPLTRRALEAKERTLGPDHQETLVSVNNLALLLEHQGDGAAAEPLFRRALEAQERVLGPEHPDTLTSVNNLGLLYFDQKEYGRAEPLFRRAFETYTQILGSQHPRTLIVMSSLALLLACQRDYESAEPLTRRALEAKERVLGPDHPETLTSANNLALLLERQGDYIGAELLFRRALEGLERILVLEHPHTRLVRASWERCSAHLTRPAVPGSSA